MVVAGAPAESDSTGDKVDSGKHGPADGSGTTVWIGSETGNDSRWSQHVAIICSVACLNRRAALEIGRFGPVLGNQTSPFRCRENRTGSTAAETDPGKQCVIDDDAVAVCDR